MPYLKNAVLTPYLLARLWKPSLGSITSNTATSAPASARPSAKDRPHPRAPPVTKAVRPLRENWIDFD